jgi:hypothetical protein
MNADKATLPAPAPPPQQNANADLKALCEKIRREVSLTPPSVIDDLCEGVLTRWIYLKASYIEEVLELALMLNREDLLRFKADCR